MTSVTERKGPGREAVDGATKVERVTVCLEDRHRPKLKRLGGSAWVRAKLDAEPDQVDDADAHGVS